MKPLFMSELWEVLTRPVQVASAASDCYDLILMDVQMPGMNGFAAKPFNIEALMRTLADILK